MVTIGVAEVVECQSIQESGGLERQWDLAVRNGIGVVVVRRWRIFPPGQRVRCTVRVGWRCRGDMIGKR